MHKGSFPYVSIIIPVLNNPDGLRLCLESLDKQTYPKDNYEIVVVDDGSDEDIEKLTARFNRVVLSRQRRCGAYTCRNEGISMAKGEVIAFTDSDCIPAFDWIENGVEALFSADNCGLAAGKIEIFFKNLQRPTAVELFESVTAFQQKRYIERWQFGATANIFTFKKVFDKVGLFDITLDYAADSEWGKRVFLASYKQVYADEARVAHPARRFYKDLLKKHIAVVRNLDQMARKNSRNLKSFLIDLKDDWPQLSDYLGVWSDKRLHGNWQKIKVVFVMSLLKIMRIAERIRLRMVIKQKI